MKENLEKILYLPTKQKLLILVGVMGAIFILFWLAIYSPVQKEVSKLDDEINGQKGLRSQVIQKEAIARNLKPFTEEVRKLNVELEKALSELPDQREIDNLLSRVSDKARDSGLEIRLFKPQAEVKRDFYAEVPVDIEVSGTFHQVATFFDEVGHLERIVNLDQFGMNDAVVDDDLIFLKTSVVATSFRFLEESERPVESDDTGKKKSKKRSKKTKKPKE